MIVRAYLVHVVLGLLGRADRIHQHHLLLLLISSALNELVDFILGSVRVAKFDLLVRTTSNETYLLDKQTSRPVIDSLLRKLIMAQVLGQFLHKGVLEIILDSSLGLNELVIVFITNISH